MPNRSMGRFERFDCDCSYVPVRMAVLRASIFETINVSMFVLYDPPVLQVRSCFVGGVWLSSMIQERQIAECGPGKDTDIGRQ